MPFLPPNQQRQSTEGIMCAMKMLLLLVLMMMLPLALTLML